MKENNQKIQKKSWGIIIAVLSVCIIATAFFDYVNINLAGKIPILDKILEFAGISEEYLKISPSELIAHTSSAQDILGELGIDRGGTFWKLAVFLFLPYVFAIISEDFGYSEKTYSAVVLAVSALQGSVILFEAYLQIIQHSSSNSGIQGFRTSETGAGCGHRKDSQDGSGRVLLCRVLDLRGPVCGNCCCFCCADATGAERGGYRG